MIPATRLRMMATVAAFLQLAATPADRDTVEYVAAPTHARFRVPKFWQHRDVAAVPADIGFLFDPAPASNKPKNPMFQQFVELYLAPAKENQTTLAAVADAARQELLHGTPTIKFTKNAAANFAGRPTWTLQWTEKIILYGGPGADGKPQKIGAIDMDRVEYVWLEHATVCHIGLHADTRFIPSLTQKATGVAKSLAWDTAPASQPAARPKMYCPPAGAADADGMQPLELLDPRRYFAAQPITFTGTSGADHVLLTYAKGLIHLTLNGVTHNLDTKLVNRVNLKLLGGNDTVVTGAGADRMTTPLFIDAGDGDDIVSAATAGNNTILGGAGDDFLEDGAGNDIIHGNDGNDLIVASAGNDTIYGDAGNDDLGSQSTVITVITPSGTTTDKILDDHDYLYGGAGNDLISVENGHAHAYGEAGNDQLSLGGQGSVGSGGDGNDILRCFGYATLSGGNGNDKILGGLENDSLVGGAGNDTIDGSGGNDTLYGGEGNDTLTGGTGRDQLHGSGGNDVLIATDGLIDLLDGGDGTDYAQIDHTAAGLPLDTLKSIEHRLA